MFTNVTEKLAMSILTAEKEMLGITLRWSEMHQSNRVVVTFSYTKIL